MRKQLVVLLGLLLAASFAQAAKVKDWKDLDKVHNHIKQAINEMQRARAANHYDMAGHGAQAESLLNQAEAQLAQAVEAAKAGN